MWMPWRKKPSTAVSDAALWPGGPREIELAWTPGGSAGDALDWPWWVCPQVRPSYVRACAVVLPEPVSSAVAYQLEWAPMSASSPGADVDGVVPDDMEGLPAWVGDRLKHDALRQHYALLLQVTGLTVDELWLELRSSHGRSLTPIGMNQR